MFSIIRVNQQGSMKKKGVGFLPVPRRWQSCRMGVEIPVGERKTCVHVGGGSGIKPGWPAWE